MHTSLSRFALILSALAISATLVFSATLVRAQEENVTFPVAELGGCENKDACHAYCDDLAHVNECVAFAETHGLMSGEEARQAREFAKLGGEGPGGCTSRDSCEAYCENVAHIRECLAFAEEHDVLPQDEIEDARAVARALEAGAELPGGCTSKATCEAYCEDSSHMRQCLAFAKKAGFMSGEELAEAEKVAAFLESGGEMPGGCHGERECKTYCESGEHMEECAQFAIQAGFMSPEEAEMFRKTGGKGPGGCRARECETYCEDGAHQEECVAFAIEHDLMSEEDKQRMEEGMQKAREAIEKAPPEVLSCIEAAIGSAKLEEIRTGRGFVGPRLGEVLPQCFREVMGNGPQGGPFGPGSAAAECMRQVFGDDFEEKMRNGNVDPGARDKEIRECMQAKMGEGFLNDKGGWERPQQGEPMHDGSMGPGPGAFQGPGGCSGPEECQRYCSEHPDECRGFGPPRGEANPYRPEGLMPMEAFRSDPNHPGMQLQDPGPDATPEQRRIFEMNMQRYQEFQNNPGQFQDPSMMPPGTFDAQHMPPPDGFVPPPEGFSPPPEVHQEPVTMGNQFIANVMSVFESLLGL